ncbi:MAG: 3-phosphoshikimate 1-carboxyvinyltransferase [Brevinematales bacterium]|nr:3-phosphoshikimate 1-carboxyvinyltransferase [Brevinematales bacterium]
MLEYSDSLVRIHSIGKYIDKSLTIPGSKSITNRVLLISALNRHRITIRNVLVSDDTNHMLKALKDLGFEVAVYTLQRPYRPEIEDFIGFIQGKVNDSLSVSIGGSLSNDYLNKTIYTGNSGTTMRFLCGFLPLLKGEFILDGDSRMRERPIRDLVNALRSLGVDINDNNGYPPVIVRSKSYVRGGEVVISGSISSQYISSLMMSGPYYENGLKITVSDDLVSRPFVDMTSKVMLDFGVAVKNRDYKVISIPKSFYNRKDDYTVEPDLTNAFYFLSVPCVIPSKISVYGVGAGTVQGDIRFVEVLRELGCKVEVGEGYISVEGDGNPKGIEVDMNDIPDLVQTLAVISLFADGPTTVRNVYNLRIKETDRISAICKEVSKLGASIEEYRDGFKLIPKKSYKPVSISTYNDHRMAMSFALAGLRIDGLVIEDYKCTSKTFPSFWNYFEFLYYNHL